MPKWHKRDFAERGRRPESDPGEDLPPVVDTGTIRALKRPEGSVMLLLFILALTKR